MKLAEALRLSGLGHRVFPCRNKPGTDEHKAPYTLHGFKDATRDERQIRRWWNLCPDALIGVPTGHLFVVVDVDLQHVPAQEWYGKANLPVTRTHYTPSGGRHVLFKPHPKFTCGNGKIWPNIDSKGLGGYVIYWPAEGLPVLHPDKLADVPGWIIEKLNPPPPPARAPISDLTSCRAEAKLNGIIRTIANASEGERNAVTFWGGCRLAEMVAAAAISPGDAAAIAVEAASRAGLPRQEASRTVKSAFRKAGI